MQYWCCGSGHARAAVPLWTYIGCNRLCVRNGHQPVHTDVSHRWLLRIETTIKSTVRLLCIARMFFYPQLLSRLSTFWYSYDYVRHNWNKSIKQFNSITKYKMHDPCAERSLWNGKRNGKCGRATTNYFQFPSAKFLDGNGNKNRFFFLMILIGFMWAILGLSLRRRNSLLVAARGPWPVARANYLRIVRWQKPCSNIFWIVAQK